MGSETNEEIREKSLNEIYKNEIDYILSNNQKHQKYNSTGARKVP